MNAWMLSDSGDDEDTLEKEGGDTHNAGWLKSALLVIIEPISPRFLHIVDLETQKLKVIAIVQSKVDLRVSKELEFISYMYLICKLIGSNINVIFQFLQATF